MNFARQIPRRFISLAMLLLFLGACEVQADNTQIVRCRVQNADWTALFVVDSVGEGFVKLKRTKDSLSKTCQLQVRSLYDGQRAVLPQFRFDFVRGSCDPELGELKGEILKKLVLKIELWGRNNPRGVVQWLRRKQPDTCKVEKADLLELHVHAKRWREGQWGRGAASESPKPRQER